jgi:hypothetical protein
MQHAESACTEVGIMLHRCPSVCLSRRFNGVCKIHLSSCTSALKTGVWYPQRHPRHPWIEVGASSFLDYGEMLSASEPSLNHSRSRVVLFGGPQSAIEARGCLVWSIQPIYGANIQLQTGNNVATMWCLRQNYCIILDAVPQVPLPHSWKLNISCIFYRHSPACNAAQLIRMALRPATAEISCFHDVIACHVCVPV